MLPAIKENNNSNVSYYSFKRKKNTKGLSKSKFYLGLLKVANKIQCDKIREKIRSYKQLRDSRAKDFSLEFPTIESFYQKMFNKSFLVEKKPFVNIHKGTLTPKISPKRSRVIAPKFFSKESIFKLKSHSQH